MASLAVASAMPEGSGLQSIEVVPRADVSGLGDRLAASGALLHFNDGIDRLADVRPVVWMSRAASLYDLVGG